MNLTKKQSDKPPMDQYFTPVDCGAAEALAAMIGPLKGKVIWEPAAGGGHLAYALGTAFPRASRIITTDLDTGPHIGTQCPVTGGVDFLQSEKSGADWVITNPPYSAEEGTAAKFFRKALDVAPNVAMLLRLGWMEACRDRLDLLPLIDSILVLDRINFLPQGDESAKPKNQSQPSAWFISREGLRGYGTRVEWAYLLGE